MPKKMEKSSQEKRSKTEDNNNQTLSEASDDEPVSVFPQIEDIVNMQVDLETMINMDSLAISMKCFNNWLSSGVFNYDELLNGRMVQMIFNLMSYPSLNEGIHALATESIMLLISLIKFDYADIDCRDTIETLINYQWFVYRNVRLLETSLHADPNTYSKRLNFSRIFCYLCETFLTILFHGGSQQEYYTQRYNAIKDDEKRTEGTLHDIVNVPLEPDDITESEADIIECLNLVLSTIDKQVFQLFEPSLDLWHTIGFLLQNQSEWICNKFRPYFERYLEMLSIVTQINTSSSDNNFHLTTFTYREKVTPVIRNVASIISLENFHEYLYRVLQDSDKLFWRHAEAAIYILQEIIPFVKYDNTLPAADSIPLKFINCICTQSQKFYILVRYHCVELLGDLLTKFEYSADIVDKVLMFLISCFKENTPVVDAAIQTISQLFTEQWTKMLPFRNRIIFILNEMERFDLRQDLFSKVMHAIAEFIKNLEDSLYRKMFKEILFLHLMPFKTLLREKDEICVMFKKYGSNPLKWLERLKAFLEGAEIHTKKQHKEPCHPVITVLNEIWPMLLNALQNFVESPVVRVAITDVFSIMLRMADISCYHLVESLLPCTYFLYKTKKMSVYLLINKTLVEIFVKSPVYNDKILKMMETLCDITSEFLCSDQRYCTFLNDFLPVCGAFVKHAPLLYYKSKLHEGITQMNLYGCTTSTKNVVEKSLMLLILKLSWGLDGSGSSSSCRAAVHDFTMKYSSHFFMSLIYIHIRNYHDGIIPLSARVIMILKQIIPDELLKLFIYSGIDALPCKKKSLVNYFSMEEVRTHLADSIVEAVDHRSVCSILEDLASLNFD